MRTCFRWFVPSVLLTAAMLLAVACQALPASPIEETVQPGSEGDFFSTPTPGADPSPTATVPIPSSPSTPDSVVHAATLAGTWYPADPEQLSAAVDQMLATTAVVDGSPLALLVPHAGYEFSGEVAAAGFKQMLGKKYDVAIIIAADHQAPVSRPISVWAAGAFETPLGMVPIDENLAQALMDANPQIVFDPDAFQDEHPIEIELPFLQKVCPDCALVPILMGNDDEETIQTLTRALLSTLPDKGAIIIASSDMSHYPNRQDALQVDGTTLAAIETKNPSLVRQTTADLMTQGYANLLTCACGEAPLLVAMQVADGLGANTVSVLRYANSADSDFGDEEQVVGYGAVMFWEYKPPDLTPDRQQILLDLARDTINDYVTDETIPEFDSEDPQLNRLAGAFVTIKQGDELRGCIGHTRADTPLYRVIQEMVVAAATQDPRFPPLTEAELEEISIEISVLSPMQRITNLENIEIGADGLLLNQYGHQGIFLPQVPVEQGWERQEYLSNLCLKAGLMTGCWKENPTIYKFTAIVFGDQS